MASIKKPTYKVETKLAVDRKRRKSDLVIMWQSIWGVTAIIVNELWMTIIRMWEFIQLWFSSSERFLVQTWLEKYLSYVPEDFAESWRDGCLMAILLNKLRPGCFPDAYRLDPDYGLKNVYRVFDALEIYFGIKPNVSVEEIVTCSEGSDSKLFEIFLELKKFTDNQSENQGELEPEPQENVQQTNVRESCIPKGAGLTLGFVGKTTSFILCYTVMADLDIVVEIRGPNSICSERITKRSPKKKRSVGSWEDTSRPQLTRTTSYNKDNDLITEEDENFEKRIIPLEYEIIGNQIRLSYKPKEKGKHKVTILWHGGHISGSPYIVTVEDPSEISRINKVMYLKSSLKTTNVCERNEIPENSRKTSVRFQESEGNIYKDRKKCKILSRRVLKYIVKINGKFIPVNAENTESLATELLKMDYDFDKCSSSHRRNSWGFTGDAERKKSVIRQFCVDVNELDSQISQRRSRSLSVSPGPKNLLQKSDSFDSLTSNLNIVNEDNFESHEKATDYAYINEDLDDVSQKQEVTHNDVGEVYTHTDIEKEKPELSSELTEGKFVESLSYVKDAKVSSLSTDIVLNERVDNCNVDLQPNISQDSVTLTFNEPCVGKIIEVSSNNQSSLDVELHPKNRENESGNEGNVSKTPKSLKVLNSSEGLKNNSKLKNYNKCSCCCLLKRYRTKRIVEKFPTQTFRKKVSRKKNSLPLSPTSAPRKLQGNNKHYLKTEKNTSLKYLENRLKDSMTSDVEYGKDKTTKDAEDTFIENLNESIDENDTSSIKEQGIRNIEENKLTEEIHGSKHLIHNKTEITCNASKSREPRVKNIDLKSNSNRVPKSWPHSNIEMNKYSNISESKPLRTLTLKPIEQFVKSHSLSEFPKVLESETKHDEKAKSLRTHSLKAIGEFNFKQFTPYFENQNSISPIKLQIGHWESTFSADKPNTSWQKIHTPDTEQVSVKEKLAFWENAYQTERIPSQQQQQQTKNNRKVYLMETKKSIIFTGDKSVAENKDLHTVYSTDNKSSALVSIVEGETETGNSINKETNLEILNQADDKVSSKLELTSPKFKIRSFSDPVILETAIDEPDILVNTSALEPSKNVFSSSSTDDNQEQCDSDNSEDSGCDYILHSTEDEYIDDEISENASEYWGDLGIVKGWKVAGSGANGNSYSLLEEEFLQSCKQNKLHPGECEVFGIAVYYGHVAIKNRFQVYTGDAGFGRLSVSMQGFRQYDVSLVSVAYVRNDIYEVTYQVMTAGYYLILIRWMDKEIHGSPFVCKVTF